MSSSKSLVINCGASHVAAAVFSSNNGQLKLEELVTRELNYDFTSDEAWLPALGASLRDISRVNSRIRGKATFILPGYQLLTKPIKVPHVEATKQAQIIAFEAQNNLPFPMHEAVWGSQVIADDGVETEVILIAQKADQANRFCGFMATQGFEVISLQPASILDFNAYRLVHPSDDTDTLLVNVGARSTNLTFLSPAGFFVRNINLGGNALTQSIADITGKPFLQAEQIKVAYFSGQTSFDADDPAVAPIQQKAQDFMKKLGQEITRSIVTYRRASTRAAPQRILLTGRASLLPGLPEFLGENQKVAVEYLKPTTTLTFGGKVNHAMAEQFSYQLSEVIGDAVRLVKKDAAGVNLLPIAILKRQQFRKQIPFLVAAAACLALAPAPALVQYYFKNKIAVQQDRELKRHLTELQTTSQDIQAQSEQAEKISDRISQFEGLMNSRANWIVFFADLQNVLVNAKDVWLDSLTVTRDTARTGRRGGARGNNRSGPGPRGGDANPDAPVPYLLTVKGRMLVRDYNPDRPSSATAITPRLRTIKENLLKNTFIKSLAPVANAETYDSITDKRWVGFSFTFVINPEKPL